MQMGSPSGLALFLGSVPLMKTWHSYTPVSAAVTFCRTKDASPSSICLSCRSIRLSKYGRSFTGSNVLSWWRKTCSGCRSGLLHSTPMMSLFGARHVPAPLWWFSGLKQSREVKVTAAAASQTETAELCWTGPEYEEVYHQLGVWQNMIHIEFSERISLKKSSTSIWIWMTFVFSLTFSTFL